MSCWMSVRRCRPTMTSWRPPTKSDLQCEREIRTQHELQTQRSISAAAKPNAAISAGYVAV
jgi:hypothetical protein